MKGSVPEKQIGIKKWRNKILKWDLEHSKKHTKEN